MYFKFQIKPVAGPPERDGDTIVRFTGQSEYNNVNDILASTPITRNGKRVVRFKTGLDVNDISSNVLIPSTEKDSFKKQVESYLEDLNKYFGEEDLNSTNDTFWKDGEHGRLKIINTDLEKFYDTKDPDSALLYFNIMGGGFIDTVAPSKEYAEVFRIPYFMETEAEYVSMDSDSYATKAKAFTLLSELNESADNQALLYLGWVLHSDSKGFGSYTISTPKSELFKLNAEYIEGKLSFSKKRNAPQKFIEVATSWKDGKVGRPRIIVEAYLKAAQVYSYINSDKEGKLSLPNGLQLGYNIESAIDTLLKPKNSQEFEELRTFIEKKWAE